MEVNKKRLSEIFGVSIRTIQNWQDQGMPVARGGGKGNEVLYDSAAVIEWYSARDAAIENEKLVSGRYSRQVSEVGLACSLVTAPTSWRSPTPHSQASVSGRVPLMFRPGGGRFPR